MQLLSTMMLSNRENEEGLTISGADYISNHKDNIDGVNMNAININD